MPAPKKNGRPKGAKDTAATRKTRKVNKIIELKARGVAVRDICKAVNSSPDTVYMILKQFQDTFKQLDNVPKYKEVRTQLLTATELQLLQSLNDKDKLDKATLNNVAYAFKQVYDSRRLEQGLSTANTTTVSFTLDKPADR